MSSAINGSVDADSVNAAFRAMALDRIEDLAKSLLGELDPVKRRAGVEAIISVAAAGRREPDAATRDRLSEKIRQTRQTRENIASPAPTEPRDVRNPDFVPRPALSLAAAPSTPASRTVRRATPRYF